jgi:integrase/recombinase XerD
MMDLVRAFADELAAVRGRSDATVRSYAGDLADLARFMAEQGVERAEDVRPHHLSLYMHRLKGDGRSEATVSRRLASARAFFAFLQRRSVIADNPAVRVERPRLVRVNPRTLKVDEVERLLAAPSPRTPQGLRDRAMLDLMYASGLKASELVALNVDDVRLDLSFVRCAAGKKERLVPVDGVCAQKLRDYLTEGRPRLARKGGEALFVGRAGDRMTRQALWKTLKKHAASCGLDPAAIAPQTLRHSFAVHLLERGADLRAVQDLLGHAHLSTTQMYASIARPRARDVYDRLHPRAAKPNESDPME